MTDAKMLTVFYNGACPICHGEIQFYRRRRGADAVSWVDVSRVAADEVVPGLAKHQALGCLQALYADGTLVSGGAALAGLWVILPGFRPWARLARFAFPRDQAGHGGAIPDWPIDELPSDRTEVPLEGHSARFASQRNFLVKSIVRLRSRAAR